MKWIDNLIYTLLSACLLAGCEDSGSKELERMQGYWVHVRGHPAFTLSETGGRYTVTRKANVRGRILETAYPVTERNGCLLDRKSTHLNSSHRLESRMPSSA